MGIIKKLILFLSIVFPLYSFSLWKKCVDFASVYHFSRYDLELQLTDAIHTDTGPLILTRIFHNKPVFLLLDIFKRYTSLLDINLFVSILSLVGIVGVGLGIWYLLSYKKSYLSGFLILLILLFPLVVVVNPSLPFKFLLPLFFSPFFLLGAYGHYKFIEENRLKKVLPIFYLVLFILSLLMIFAYPQSAYTYCATQ